MRSSHTASAVTAAFDEPNLVADAGLVAVVRLAERAGLPSLTSEAVRITDAGNGAGADPGAKVMSLVAAMCAGADSIDDADRLRHGAMAVLFDQVRAPSTLGMFLRSFTHGHALQLHAVHRRLLRALTMRLAHPLPQRRCLGTSGEGRPGGSTAGRPRVVERVYEMGWDKN